jgi:hypothetical protein
MEAELLQATTPAVRLTNPTENEPTGKTEREQRALDQELSEGFLAGVPLCSHERKSDLGKQKMPWLGSTLGEKNQMGQPDSSEKLRREPVCCLRWMSLCACDTTRTATEHPSSRGEQHEKEKKIWRPLRHEENRAEIQNRDRAAAGISTEQITGCYTYCAMGNQTSERTTPAADQAHATRKISVLDKMKDSPADKLRG